jgi:hypothetical protein
MATVAELPDYPFWQADGAEAAFGADSSHYSAVGRSEASSVSRQLRKQAKVFSALFFSGGSLADHGLRWKPELAEQRPMMTLRALMCSFDPPHEVKEATVALALHHWCEPIPASEQPSA